MKSELCLCDTEGRTEKILTYEGLIEAPNWHPAGYLIVNGRGRIYRVPLSAPDLHEIDTGFAVKCNNDHGISPDGTRLVISDSTRHGKSCIYTLPIDGGTPHQVTRAQPSWWHGWSPDGTTLVYAAARGDRKVKIYRCPAEGGRETLVCDAFDHIDGPDFSADGDWIWFNGERSGQVDLWRIRPDGSDPERMTDGETVDWFPHPSPDGAHVVWLAYAPGTQGHPGGLDVTLNIMDGNGGEGRILTRLHGGQGTINVPCWAPDSSLFAFMRYVP
ncbi:TolB family protein [Roseisalinus antarcticus]|uniref:Translocation protein TolB n=1 Tax=Roseisalinus antarcticus TaxID=254357 RepID=A0A1Y5S0Z3_9RHOB|nr:PD40 domain-containing protein [Roseisalinus antarcticus]SLN27138.1 translocation protein TolB [Roseisalinus antarcticus]